MVAVWEMSATDLAMAVSEGRLSAREVAGVLERIEAVNPRAERGHQRAGR